MANAGEEFMRSIYVHGPLLTAQYY